MERRADPSIPGVRSVLLGATLLAPILAFMESLTYLGRSHLTGEAERWIDMYGKLLVPWGILALCVPLVLLLVVRWPLNERPRAQAISAHIAGALLFPVVHLTLLAVVHKVFWGTSFVEHLQWLLADVYSPDLLVFCAIAGALYAIRFVRERRSLAEESLQLRSALLEARLAALQGQLRPHFLFNALNSVAMLVREGDQQQAVDVLARVSDLIRQTLRERDDDVTLREEFALVREYLEIEHVRFGDRLALRFELENAAAEMRVPFLLLQPLAENAVRHGVNDRRGTSSIVLRATVGLDSVRISVEEHGDGASRGASVSGLGIGLRNTRERLAARFGPGASLDLSVDPAGRGSTALLTLPRKIRESRREVVK